ncbi:MULTISPECIES: LysR family transcriptional regulator [unclassified Streptomyces]|uniref:LysR family transcriptional regulator n=1 Tax=unclassified Streptomyces TaxID=2593676 RepID=UPI0038017768
MFDSTRLAALVAVAEAGSITRAAARLGYTAPALSQQLAKLEREAGAELLVRTHRGARLTAAGEVLVSHARRALDEMDRARLELSQLAGPAGGRLRIGTFTTAGIHLLPPVLTALRREHPQVDVVVAEYEPPAGVAAVAAGDADLALTHVYEGGPDPAPPTGVAVEPLLVEDLVLITAPGHLLAAAPNPLEWAELEGQPLVSSTPDHPNRRAIEATLRAAGVRPVVVCETPAYVTVCALVSAGLGVGLVPRMMAASSAVPLGVRALAPPGLHRTIALASRNDDTSPALRTLRALLLGTYRKPPAG